MQACERTAFYLDGELPPSETPAVLEHVAGCLDCQRDLGDWLGLALVIAGGFPPLRRAGAT